MTDPEATAHSRMTRRLRDGALIAGGASLSLLGTTLLCMLAMAVVGRGMLGPARDYPSDKGLIARYVANKAKFEQLADMMIAEQEIAWVFDGQCQLKDQWIVTGDENERCQAYLELCHELEIETIAMGEEPFTLYVDSYGGTMGGSVLGYEYANGLPPSGLVGDTRQRADGQAGGVAYHHIEGNWYIFLWDG